MTFAEARDLDPTVKQMCLDGADDKLIIATLAKEKQALEFDHSRLKLRLQSVVHQANSKACLAYEAAVAAKAQGNTTEHAAENRKGHAYQGVADWITSNLEDD